MDEVIEINGVEYIKRDCVKQAGTEDRPYVIVRTYSAGVFAGYLKSHDGKEATLENARRLWYWEGAASLSQLAKEGVKYPSKCKFPCEIDVTVTEAIEIISCSIQARESIQGVKIWEIE